MDDKILDTIIPFLSRKASTDELQALKTRLENDAAFRDELKAWFRAWEASGMADSERFNANEAYRRFLFRQNGMSKIMPIRETRFETAMRTFRRMAAVFILGLITGGVAWFFFSKHTPQVPTNTYVESIVPLGSKTLLQLPDGSTVWLNAGSRLRYPMDYGQTERNIYLEGEGYFKVAKQENKPFVVHTEMMKVRALGTEFNVKAYPGDQMEETTLVNGEVVVDRGLKSGLEQIVTLKPGQKVSVSAAVADKQTVETAPKTLASQTNEAPKPLRPIVSQLPEAEKEAEVSWKDRNWRIEREELQNLAVKLERRYDVCITVDNALKTHRFSGTLKDESLEQVLTAMSLSAPILFKVNGKKVNIFPDPKKLKSQ